MAEPSASASPLPEEHSRQSGAQRAAYFTQTLLPNIPTDRQLLIGGDFNCVARQLDVLGPDSSVLGRTTGYYDGLRIAETDRQLFDI
ncbi:g11628 [Coccomyxa viridis]|uniref:G11628 protein n=1 Tax=Coccomyxa viridis TaxID=1274662 RepID=A0ABP1G8D0_9CHLO